MLKVVVDEAGRDDTRMLLDEIVAEGARRPRSTPTWPGWLESWTSTGIGWWFVTGTPWPIDRDGAIVVDPPKGQ